MHESLTVAVGDTLRWTNRDRQEHTTTSTEGEWDSGTLLQAFEQGGVGGMFDHTFTTVGTFAYICTIHPQMTGTITVE